MPRCFIEREVCVLEYTLRKVLMAFGENRCAFCREIKNDYELPLHGNVKLFLSLSYECIVSLRKQIAAQRFLKQHGRNFTLFHSSPKKCDQPPKRFAQ